MFAGIGPSLSYYRMTQAEEELEEEERLEEEQDEEPELYYVGSNGIF